MIPPALIGGTAKSVDWSNSSFASEMAFNSTAFDPSMVLPICMAELVPYWIGVIGLASVRYALSHQKVLLSNTFKSTMCINEKIKFYNNVTNSSAAAMSSVDSSLLSGATYLTHNIYGKMVEISNDIGQFSQNR